MDALDDLLRIDWEEEVWRSYVAGALWRLDGAWGGKDMPRYEDLIAESNAQDISKEEIVRRRNVLIEKLSAGGGEEA